MTPADDPDAPELLDLETAPRLGRKTRVQSAIANRKRRAVQANASARSCIGPLEPGMALFAVTRGQFSMIDVINDLVWKMGKADVSVWTWAIAEYEVEVFTALLDRREIGKGTLVVDYTAEGRNPGLLDKWRDRFGEGSVRVVRTHAKIARVWNDDLRFLARGSMNLNFNPRFEQFDLTEGGQDFDLVTELEDELAVLPRGATRAQAEANSRLDRAWTAQQLELWGPMNDWKK